MIGDLPDDEPDKQPRAVVDWGDDVSPKIEQLLEFWHTRVYNGFHESEELRKRLSAEEWAALAAVRCEADELLDEQDRRDLKLLEEEIQRIERGDAPIDSTHELDVAWCSLLADARDLPGGGDSR